MEKLVITKIREHIKNQELSISKDYFNELETILCKVIDDSCKRCIANDRKTVMARDL